MNARRVGLVAWHVFKENVRDRVLYGIVAFAVLMVAASILIGQITAGQDVKVIKDLGLAVIELAGVLMAVFIGVGLVSREIDRRSIFALLAKPLPRAEFIAGKYLGLVLTVTVNVALMTVAFYAMLAWLWWTSPLSVRASWEAPAMDPQLLLQIVLIVGELALLTAISLLFSAFSSSALLSMAFTLAIFIVGLESADLRHFSENVAVRAPGVAALVTAIGWMVPAFSAFSDRKNDVVHGIAIAPAFLGYTLLYGLVYAAAALAAAMAIFSRREFK